MKTVNSGKCLSFFVGEFKLEVESKKAEKIVYLGSRGVCFSMAQLFGYSIRDTVKNQYFIPDAEIENSVEYELTDIGYRFFGLENKKNLDNPDILVIMGGIATKHSKATIEEITGLIENLNPKIVMGISICNVFDKSGCLEKINFDSLIDGTLEPVVLMKK
ncbi:DUF2124 family protein [Methanococcus maripaludis]|jgi:hypothetical protein|uniref:DUF2124 family protein n=2 Tax=Methanococcus maripaludis TaxID=39152 RepID=A0A8T3VZT9_METMI|nr:DUF2124 family protein [Methanococcus maripaludis]MBG0769787.1 DUF2124 family protein [Methanococcus maripaludis]BAP60728.1 hypothetical protein MMKA1_06110 [Methanococcus maripaludis KA1]